MTLEEEFVYAINHWNIRKGNGSFVIPYPLDSLKPIYLILPKLFNKNPTTNVVIVVNDFAGKDEVKDYLCKQGNSYDSIFLKFITNGQIKILSADWVASNIDAYKPNLAIIYKPESMTSTYASLLDKSIYKLVILNKRIADIDKFYSVCPLVKEFTQSDVDTIRTSPPVEEMRIPIDIDANSHDAELLKYYNDNIRISLNIFGGIDNLKCAMTGKSSNNTSAMTYCDKLARDNGWNEYLDMSVEYNQQIDSLYNPIAIQERANVTYDMIRKRSRLVANCSNKINAICDIVRDNINKKILIINKYAEFADDITKNINIAIGDICRSYHDKLETIPAIDKEGNAIYYKSGANKGERKNMGVISQKKLYQQMFNMNKINVLSLSNAPDKALNVDADIVIITSSLCEELSSYIYRLDKVNFSTPIKLYSLYCKGTMEERAIDSATVPTNHVIVKSGADDTTDENNFDYTIVD